MSMINALFIDPYRCEIRHCEVESDIRVWHKLLQCDCCDVRSVMRSPWGTRLDVWFDDEYLCKHEEIGPSFRFIPWQEGQEPLSISGYGLITGTDSDGASVSVNEEGFRQSQKRIKGMLRLQFERWQQRLHTDDYVDQLLRTPETEPALAGKFRYLDIPEESGKLRTS